MRTGMLTHAALALSFAVLAASAGVGGAFPPEGKGAGRGKERFASWDDVNVLAHGLLQLGQGLKEHVDKAKGQARDVAARLRAAEEAAGALGGRALRLEQDGAALREQAERALNASAELREERRRVDDRLRRLEEALHGAPEKDGRGDPRIVQRMLDAQNQRINDLEDRIRLQQDKLDKQNGRIRTLQNQIHLKKERSFLRRTLEEDTQNGRAHQSDSPIKVASDCHQLFLGGEASSGIYTIQPAGSQPFQVFCEMTAEGGWTVIQRRQDGSVDFDQQWQAYRNGFGNLKGEFWLGLEKTRSIVKDQEYILQMTLSDWKDDTQSIRYAFGLDGEEKAYALHLLDMTPGGPGSALSTEPSGLPFSTRDRDNDQKADRNCAELLSGGWWFGGCGHSNLNGRYVQGQLPKQRHLRKQGMFWKTFQGRYHPIKTTVMKMAPAKVRHGSLGTEKNA